MKKMDVNVNYTLLIAFDNTGLQIMGLYLLLENERSFPG